MCYFLFYYKAPPEVLDNRYLLATQKIEVWDNIDGSLINEIVDPNDIEKVVSSLEQFEKLKSGQGGCVTHFTATFILADGRVYELGFDEDCVDAEIVFSPDVQFTCWDRFNVRAGTLVPVYKVDMSEEVRRLLLKQ